MKDFNVMIVVPPFASLEQPSLGVHILQACAKQEGYKVKILYLNLALADAIGADNYNHICLSKGTMIGEKFFAPTAYNTKSCFTASLKLLPLDGKSGPGINVAFINEFHSKLDDWVNIATDKILEFDFDIFGCSTTFEQTAASVALINSIKRKRPDITTIIGGANCEGELAEGVLTLSPNIDYAFSGESEEAFVSFLDSFYNGQLPENKVITGNACENLDALPPVDYSEYYIQIRHLLPDFYNLYKGDLKVVYETSRGCWWGQKHQCTFCGVNGKHLSYRCKSPDKVIQELKLLLDSHPSKRVHMADNIMPYTYFENVVKRLPTELPEAEIFYETKSNLTLEQLIALKKAGICGIQPGIEALSSALLKRMNKGVMARQNLALLRYCKCLNLQSTWNILHAFPQDTAEEYAELSSIISLISHLEPPYAITPMGFCKFSQYYYHPEKFGIKNLRPPKVLEHFLPDSTDIDKISYNYVGDYEYYSKSNTPMMQEVYKLVERWKVLWDTGKIPKLNMLQVSSDKYLIVDTREVNEGPTATIINEQMAFAALLDRPVSHIDNLGQETEWAVNNKYLLEIDDWYISLVTSDPQLILDIKSRYA